MHDQLPGKIGDSAAFAKSGRHANRGGVDLFSPRALVAVHQHIDRFTSEFLAYLPDNLHIYAAFEREALKVVARGFKRYSARTIIEVLRHNSALAENGGPWKLNDHFTPFLARVFVILHPEQSELFEFRKTAPEREREAA